MLKKVISFFTALSMTLMLFTGIPISVSAVVGDLTTDGYQLDDNGKLTIATDTGMTNWESVQNTNCKKVTSVEIRSGVTSIVDRAFYGCNSLSSITIPDSVTSIGTEAFRSCTSLNSIIIPKRVNEMGGKVFYNCTNLTITFKGGPPTATGDYLTAKVSISGSGVTAIYVPCKMGASQFLNERNLIDGSLSDKIQLAHDATHIEAKEATCTAVGNKEYWKCLQCGKKFSNSECTTEINPTIPKTEHGYSTTWSYDDTNHYHECTVCGDQKDTAAHSGGTATCQTQATCSVCKQKYGSSGSHLYIS